MRVHNSDSKESQTTCSPWLSSFWRWGRQRNTVSRYWVESDPQQGFSANHRTLRRVSGRRWESSASEGIMFLLRYSSHRDRQPDRGEREQMLFTLQREKTEHQSHIHWQSETGSCGCGGSPHSKSKCVKLSKELNQPTWESTPQCLAFERRSRSWRDT